MEPFCRGRVQAVPFPNAVNAQHGFLRIESATITGFGIYRLNDITSLVRGEQDIHILKEDFLAGLTASTGKLTVGKSQLLARRHSSMIHGYDTNISYLGLIRIFPEYLLNTLSTSVQAARARTVRNGCQ